jgi:alanyl-tRNA synthetase
LKGNESLPPVCLLVGGDASEVPYVLLCSADSGQKAGDLAKLFGQKVGGGGGGRADFAQGKGKQGDSLEQAISDFRNELGSLA